MTWEVLPTLQAAQDSISTFLVKDISPENVTDHSNPEHSDQIDTTFYTVFQGEIILKTKQST